MTPDLRLWQAEYAELAIPFDFTDGGYKKRLPRIRLLAIEGRGPMAWLREFLDDCKRRRVSRF